MRFCIKVLILFFSNSNKYFLFSIMTYLLNIFFINFLNYILTTLTVFKNIFNFFTQVIVQSCFDVYFFLNNLYSLIIIDCYGDKAYNWQLGVQDPATNVMEGIINFHNFILGIIIAIGIAVGIVLFETLWKFHESKNIIPSKFAHASTLEIVWTAIPALILLYIAGPSFTLLYALDEDCSRSIVYKVTGSQWFWTYSFPDMEEFSPKQSKFSAMFVGYSQKGTKFQGFRMLETDQKLYIPVNTHVTFLITSKDVLHSWAIPSFGIKLDACPGRLAHITMFFPRTGLFYGQCSEICGTGHGFMPIVVRVCTKSEWANYLATFNANN